MQKQDETKIVKTKEYSKSTVELQKEHYEKKKAKKNKKIKLAIIFIIIFFLILIFSIIFAIMNINNDKIISGVSINGIDMSGLSQNEVRNKIQALVNEKKTHIISLKYKEYEAEISPELIEVNYDIDSIVKDAYDVGRDSNIFVNNYNILFALLNKKNIDIKVSLNEEELEKIIQDNSSKLPDAVKESSYYVEDENLIITKGKKGIIIDKESTKKKIIDNLNDIKNNSQDYIEMNIIEKEPDQIDIDKIYKEIHTEAKDAYYIKEPFQIYPEVNGVDFDINKAKELLKEDKEEYTIQLIITKPNITIDKIGTEAFPNRLSFCKTQYNAADVNRTTNLRLACDKINGKVILSGETFSYNKTVGERTIAAGYKEAKIYSAGQVVDGLGGGICQISSTLYNAALIANLEIVERRNHQFVTSYLPAGRDATVVYGLTDFQFKNTRKYPVRIVASVQNGIATVEIYGIKEEEEYDITFDTRTVGTIPFSTKYIDDASLSPGEEVITQKGTNGLQTETYIIKSLNGKVVSRSLLSKDTYTPMQRIIKRSTKSAEPATTPKNEVKTENKVNTNKENNKQNTVNEQNSIKTENKINNQTETPKTPQTNTKSENTQAKTN